jgi:hypothetical protein
MLVGMLDDVSIIRWRMSGGVGMLVGMLDGELGFV